MFPQKSGEWVNKTELNELKNVIWASNIEVFKCISCPLGRFHKPFFSSLNVLTWFIAEGYIFNDQKGLKDYCCLQGLPVAFSYLPSQTWIPLLPQPINHGRGFR